MSKGGYYGDHLRDYLPHDPSHQALYNKGALLTTMQAPKLGNQIDTNLRPYSSFASYCSICPLWQRIQSRIMVFFQLSCHFSFLQSAWFLSPVLTVMVLTFLKIAGYFIDSLSGWGFLMLSMVGFRLCVFGRTITEVMHCLLSGGTQF